MAEEARRLRARQERAAFAMVVRAPPRGTGAPPDGWADGKAEAPPEARPMRTRVPVPVRDALYRLSAKTAAAAQRVLTMAPDAAATAGRTTTEAATEQPRVVVGLAAFLARVRETGRADAFASYPGADGLGALARAMHEYGVEKMADLLELDAEDAGGLKIAADDLALLKAHASSRLRGSGAQGDAPPPPTSPRCATTTSAGGDGGERQSPRAVPCTLAQRASEDAQHASSSTTSEEEEEEATEEGVAVEERAAVAFADPPCTAVIDAPDDRATLIRRRKSTRWGLPLPVLDPSELAELCSHDWQLPRFPEPVQRPDPTSPGGASEAPHHRVGRRTTEGKTPTPRGCPPSAPPLAAEDAA